MKKRKWRERKWLKNGSNQWREENVTGEERMAENIGEISGGVASGDMITRRHQAATASGEKREGIAPSAQPGGEMARQNGVARVYENMAAATLGGERRLKASAIRKSK